MKAVSLIQPWATLVAIRAKHIETRSWRTSYRGPLAIHASKGFPTWAKETCGMPPFFEMLTAAGLDLPYKGSEVLPLGCILATCDLVACYPTEKAGCVPGVFKQYPELDTVNERCFGDYSPGRWAWVLENVQYVSPVVPAKGALSLWNWEPTA